jgi:hypothetical protein
LEAVIHEEIDNGVDDFLNGRYFILHSLSLFKSLENLNEWSLESYWICLKR